MSNEQWLGLLRTMLPAIGMLLTGMGLMKPGDVAAWTDKIMIVAGPVLTAISAVWTLIKNSKTNIVATAAAIPEVKNIALHPTPEGMALARETPPNVRTEP